MSALFPAGSRTTHPIRAGVVAAALAVTACFGAAVSVAGEPANAEAVVQP